MNKFGKIKSYWLSFFGYNQYPQGTRFPFRYHLRRFVRRIPGLYPDLSAWIISPFGAKHYLSADLLDERVIGDMLGSNSNVYFPEDLEDLLQGSKKWVMDIGAFNGSWAIELLTRFPELNAVLLEPNHEKIHNITIAIQMNRLASRIRVIEAGLGKRNDSGWLIESPSGSWGNYLQENKPAAQIPSHEVKMVTLETALNGIQPIVVKCNAEGAEYELVPQLVALGFHPSLMILFIHPEYGDPDHLWKELSSYGYSLKLAREYAPRPIWLAYYLEE